MVIRGPGCFVIYQGYLFVRKNTCSECFSQCSLWKLDETPDGSISSFFQGAHGTGGSVLCRGMILLPPGRSPFQGRLLISREKSRACWGVGFFLNINQKQKGVVQFVFFHGNPRIVIAHHFNHKVVTTDSTTLVSQKRGRHVPQGSPALPGVPFPRRMEEVSSWRVPFMGLV